MKWPSLGDFGWPPGDTFTDNDELDYLCGRSIFDGKQWNEVQLDFLYSHYVQFNPLTDAGKIYYLPTFLEYFYDTRRTNIEWYYHFMDDLVNAFVRRNSPYARLNELNPNQAKLIALFLANIANLLPADRHDANQAQAALTSYWGNFLLF
ncbi:MAG: DUF6714 family protein [Rhodocyclaceae bacterium]